MPQSQISQRYDNEAAKIRKRYNFSYAEPLNPLALAGPLGIKVIEPNDIPGVTPEDMERLRSIGGDWSGLSCSLPDGRTIVILNPFHTQARKNITLMEEICHFYLRHKPKTKIYLLGYQKINFLHFSRNEEKDAYHTGAATLVPYKGLELLVIRQNNIEEIAARFSVSTELVRMRLQITGLLNRYKAFQNLRVALQS